MARLIFIFIICVAASLTRDAHAQNATLPTPDSNGYRPPVDSMRAFDSVYRARKAMLDEWVHKQKEDAHPQQDFISVYAGYGGYLQILPRDLNQLFSERSQRPDPASDRNQFETVDRAFILSGQMQVRETWGIYVEYDLTMKWLNTQIGGSGPTEELDLTQHSIVAGGMYVIYDGAWYRLRAEAAMGGAFALTSETESPGGYAREASATGLQVNFDIFNDFRVMPSMSFTIDLLTRSVTGGELKTSNGQTLDAPFGAGNAGLSFKPTASNLVVGVAAGLVFYF